MSEKVEVTNVRTSTPDIDSTDVDMAFNPELRQAQQDWKDYLDRRPDEYGQVNIETNPDQQDSEDPLEKGVFSGDVFYNEDTEGVFSVSGTRVIGGKVVYRVRTEIPTRNGRVYKGVHEFSEQEAVEYLRKQGANLADAGHDRPKPGEEVSLYEPSGVEEEAGRTEDPISDDAESGNSLDSEGDASLSADDSVEGENSSNQGKKSNNEEELNKDDEPFIPIERIDIDEDDKGLSDAENDDPEIDKIDSIREKWLQDMLENHDDLLAERKKTRSELLNILAVSRKGHLRRIRPGGMTDNLLRIYGAAIGGNVVANYLSRPTAEEEAAGKAYALALDEVAKKRDEFMKLQELTEDELRSERLQFITMARAQDEVDIAKQQKDAVGKPMNKWLRRAGYVAAGVAGGLLTLTPLGWVGGMAVAGAGAMGLRVVANKRNANTKIGDSLVVDNVAKERADQFSKWANNSDHEFSAKDLVRDLHESTADEVGKNRNRIILPTMGALALAAATRMGIDSWITNITPEPTSETVPTPEPTSETIPTPEPTSDSGPQLPTEAYVESGSGEIRETKQVLEQVLGREVSAQDAERVYNIVGRDLFKNDPNYIGKLGDLRIGETGTFQFKDGIVQKMVDAFHRLGQ